MDLWHLDLLTVDCVLLPLQLVKGWQFNGSLCYYYFNAFACVLNPTHMPLCRNKESPLMLCETCTVQIPSARLRAVPHATTCVRCSTERAHIGFMDWHHKTAPELVMIPAEQKENIRRAKRIAQRSR